MMTSAGRLLEGAVKYGDKNGMGPALKEVLDAYAKLPEAERIGKPVEGQEKFVAAPPEGGLVLTIYDRPIAPAGDGKYRVPQGSDIGGIRTHAKGGQRSSLWLSKEECDSIVAVVKDAKKGDTWPVPANLAKRLTLYSLWPQTMWVVEHTWKPDSLKQLELNLTVDDVTPEAVKVRIGGSVLLSTKAGLKIYPTGKIAKEVENRYDARLEGAITIDRAAQKITRFDMVALGDYLGVMFVTREENGKRTGDGWLEATAEAPVPLAFAFEVDQDTYTAEPQRRRPRSFVHAYIFRDREPFYWDVQKWQDDWKKRQQK